jgi:hypothetical protein
MKKMKSNTTMKNSVNKTQNQQMQYIQVFDWIDRRAFVVVESLCVEFRPD